MFAAAVLATAAAPRAPGERRAFPEFAAPHLYGSVVLRPPASPAALPAVVFDHWRHRLLYSCRLCHVDVGFAMQAGASGVTGETNAAGMHCGACHDGRSRHAGRAIFAACTLSPPDRASPACARCHAGEDGDAEGYEKLTRTLPHDNAGLVDWERVERLSWGPPLDHVAGISPRRERLRIDRDFSIEVSGTWLGDIAFSHQKHARWTGCEGCHPEVFPSTVRGAARYRMSDILDGQYCGACHNKVAFPLALCLQCHRVAPAGAPTPP